MKANPIAVEAFGCDYCRSFAQGFERPALGRPFYKFPPTIGRAWNAELLFVGTNPRRSATNVPLHDHIAGSIEAFLSLARNRDERGRAYIARNGPEAHYAPHVAITRGIYGDCIAFEEVAAATEVFLCATEDSKGLPRERDVCAERFLKRVLTVTAPRVIYAFGQPAINYLASVSVAAGALYRLTGSSRDAVVVPLPHPNDRAAKADFNLLLPWAIEVGRSIIAGGPNCSLPPRPTGSVTQGAFAARLLRERPDITDAEFLSELKRAFPHAKIGTRHPPHYRSLVRTGKLR